jgi:hypothetical protein
MFGKKISPIMLLGLCLVHQACGEEKGLSSVDTSGINIKSPLDNLDPSLVGEGFVNQFGGVLSNQLTSSLGSFGKKGLTSLTSGFTQGFKDGGGFTGGFSGLKGSLSGGIDGIKGNITGGIDSVKNVFSGGAGGIKDAISGKIGGMKDSFTSGGKIGGLGSKTGGGSGGGGASAVGAASAALTIAQNMPGPTDFKVMLGMDWGCFLKSWKIKGVGGCWKKRKKIPYYHICLKFQHRWPTGLVEVIKKENDSNIKSPMATASNYMQSIASIAALKAIFSGTRTSNGADEGNQHGQVKHFFDARVYSHPSLIPWLEMLAEQSNNPYIKAAIEIIKRAFCNPGNSMVIMPLYNTESDFLFWRTGLHDMGKLASLKTLITGLTGCGDTGPAQQYLDKGYKFLGGNHCLGNYGPIHPRRGFISHFNLNSAAHLAGFRALSMANRGSGVKLGQYRWYMYPNDRLQMYEPEMGSCFSLQGSYRSNPHFQANATDGRFMWSHFPMIECCYGCYLRQGPP